jgi:hypothetical protein
MRTKSRLIFWNAIFFFRYSFFSSCFKLIRVMKMWIFYIKNLTFCVVYIYLIYYYNLYFITNLPYCFCFNFLDTWCRLKDAVIIDIHIVFTFTQENCWHFFQFSIFLNFYWFLFDLTILFTFYFLFIYFLHFNVVLNNWTWKWNPQVSRQFFWYFYL